MKSFEEISKIVFSTGNKERLKEELTSTELKAYTALVDIAKSFRKEEITKEQATTEKLKLKEKYEACIEHINLAVAIGAMMVDVEWAQGDVKVQADIAVKVLPVLLTEALNGSNGLHEKMLKSLFDIYEDELKEITKEE